MFSFDMISDPGHRGLGASFNCLLGEVGHDVIHDTELGYYSLKHNSLSFYKFLQSETITKKGIACNLTAPSS